MRLPKRISVSSQNSPLHLNWINATYIFLTQITQMETEKFKHWKIWSTWCQMSASPFFSSAAPRGQTESRRSQSNETQPRAEPPRSLGTPLQPPAPGRAVLNHAQLRRSAVNWDHPSGRTAQETHGQERTSKWGQAWKRCPIKAESHVLPQPLGIAAAMPCDLIFSPLCQLQIF